MSIIFDKSGRKLKLGQIVDIPVSGMMACVVTEISDGDVIIGGNQNPNPRVIVQPMPCAMNIGKNQMNNLIVPDAYIIREAPQDDSKVSSSNGNGAGVGPRKIELVQ